MNHTAPGERGVSIIEDVNIGGRVEKGPVMVVKEVQFVVIVIGEVSEVVTEQVRSSITGMNVRWEPMLEFSAFWKVTKEMNMRTAHKA